MNLSTLRDPAGLVGRSPELATLAERSPALRKAIENGRPHDAFRALFWAHKLRKLGDQTDVAAGLLGHRRIFFKPLSGTPVMFTLNGVGTRLYGRREQDPHDATYVATLFATVLYVPVFPIGSYLVRDAQGNRRAWSFMAKIPLGTITYLWQRLAAIALLLLILVGAANAFEGYGHATLHVVNGLDRPVQVELVQDKSSSKPASETIAAGATRDFRADVGKHVITVRDGDHVLETAPVDLPRGRNGVAWNVMGAAPIFLRKVTYIKHGSLESGDDEAPPKVFCGESLVNETGIDDVFVDPPKEVSMPEHTSSVTRLFLGVMKGGLTTCVGYLTSEGKGAEAGRLATSVATLEGTSAANLSPVIRALVPQGPLAQGEAFAKGLLAHDDSVLAHRLYQDVLTQHDLQDRAVAEYEARRLQRPNDADAEYLALRVRGIAEERPRIDAAVAKYPNNAYLRRIQVYVHYADREFEPLLSASEALRKIDPVLWLDSLRPHVEALVALGRGDDALTVVREVASDKSLDKSARRDAQILGYRVAHAIGSTFDHPPKPDDGDDPDEFTLGLQAETGEELSAPEIERVKADFAKNPLRIARAARSSPNGAVTLVQKVGADGVRGLEASVRLLLLGEVMRRGDVPDAASLLSVPFSKKLLGSVQAYLTSGALSDELLGLPLEERAALDFGRSRMPGLSAKDRLEALSSARAGDVLHGPVTVAIGGWPAP